MEEVAKAWVKDKVDAGIGRLPSWLQPTVRGTLLVGRLGTAAAFVSYTAGQAMAEAVAKERGLSAEAAKALRHTLSSVDVALAKPAVLACELTGLGHFSVPIGMIPMASAGYLAYSTARYPRATLRAAAKAVKGSVKWLTGKRSAEDAIETLALRFQANGGSDWYVALVCAALDKTQDLGAAIKAADKAFKKTPADPSARASRFSPDQPRDPDGKFGEGGGKADKVKVAKEGFAASMRENKDLPDAKRQEYYGAAKGVFEAMPEKAVERYNAHTVGHRFHGSTEDLTVALTGDIPGLHDKLGASKQIGGAYRPRTGTLELDGGMEAAAQSTREVYAHEMTHAVDGPRHELSESGAWQEAYRAEIAGGKLSAYAKKNAAEGLAEFGRAVYGGKADRAKVEQHFPQATKFFKENGLW